MEPVNVFDFETIAREKLSREAYDYYAGGAHDEVSVRGNRAAFERLSIAYRVLVDVSRRDMATTVLGQPVAMPLLVAPTAFHRLATPEGEVATARAAGAAGTAMILSTLSTSTDRVGGGRGDRAGLVPALRLPRPRGHGGAGAARRGRRLPRAGAHGRRAAPRPAGARRAQPLPPAAGPRRRQHAAGGVWRHAAGRRRFGARRLRRLLPRSGAVVAGRGLAALDHQAPPAGQGDRAAGRRPARGRGGRGRHRGVQPRRPPARHLAGHPRRPAGDRRRPGRPRPRGSRC